MSYQTLHLLTGFIKLPAGQWYAAANSGELDNVPITLQPKHAYHVSGDNKSSAVAEMAAQCCITPIVKRCGLSFSVKN